MSRAPITHRALGPNIVGSPGQRPDPRAVGINANARAALTKYANPEVRQRVLDVVDRKRGVASSVNSWPPASTFNNRPA
jgi:hypothetical protein